MEKHFKNVNEKRDVGASPFEILTATAFTIFNDAKVKIGVVEVGMGGTLDSTNFLNNQAVSVISKIARDHEGFLGNTLAEIAGHKAGILRPSVPYIVNSTNEANVQSIIQDYANEIGAGPRLFTTDFKLPTQMYDNAKWQRLTSTMMPFQIENLKLAVVATMQALGGLDPASKPRDLARTLLMNAKKQTPGRQEILHLTPVFRNATEKKNHVLVDGAHNPDAAATLDTFVHKNLRFGTSPAKNRPESGWPVTWVLAMTEGKDARQYLATLLRPGDKVVTTTFGPVAGMPWVKPMDPKELLQVAKSVEPQITGTHVPIIGALRAACTAKYMADQMAPWSPMVVTGSLYLVGDLHRELQPRADKKWWTSEEPDIAADREAFLQIQAEERERVKSVLGPGQEGIVSEADEADLEEQRKLQDELDTLNREVEDLKIEEERIIKESSAPVQAADDESVPSAAERLEREEQRFAELYATPEQIVAQLAMAEKAKESIARHEQAVAAAIQAKAMKTEEKRRRKERLEERKRRRQEKRKIEKERKMERRTHAHMSKNDSPRDIFRKTDSEAARDAFKIRRT